MPKSLSTTDSKAIGGECRRRATGRGSVRRVAGVLANQHTIVSGYFGARLTWFELFFLNSTTAVEMDWDDAYKLVGMCRQTAKSEVRNKSNPISFICFQVFLRKKFGRDTVVAHRRRLSAFMTIDRDAKRQVYQCCAFFLHFH